MVKIVKAYVTRYALTSGVVHCEGELFGKIFYPKLRKDGNSMPPISEREYFFEKDEAIARAESMRQKKIRSLERQLLALKAMKFEVAEG